jgi:hypothetical protein
MAETLTLTEILRALILLAIAAGAYYANEIRSALGESEAANAWKVILIGLVLVFIGGIVEPVSLYLDLDSQFVAWGFMLLASIILVYGLKLELRKVR